MNFVKINGIFVGNFIEVPKIKVNFVDHLCKFYRKYR